jgi:hypothetical protein
MPNSRKHLSSSLDEIMERGTVRLGIRLKQEKLGMRDAALP